jgi:hypothetical protein
LIISRCPNRDPTRRVGHFSLMPMAARIVVDLND